MIADELVTILGVDIKGNAMNNIRSMEAGLNKLASVAKTASVVVAGLATSAMLMVNSVTAEAADLQKTADKTGVAVEQLQELDYIAAKTGADAKALKNDIVSLTKSMSSPIPGQFNMNLMMLGVSAYKAGGGLKTSAELMGDIAEKLQGMSQQRQLQWASRVGISDETLIALKAGKEGIAALAEEAHKLGLIIPAESIKRAADFRKEIGTMRLYLDRLKQSIVIGALPVLERLLSSFKEFIDLNSGKIANGLEDFSEGFIIAWDTLKVTLGPIIDLFSKLTDLLGELFGTTDPAETWAHVLYQGMLLLLLVSAPLIAKWLLIAAAIKAVGMIVEDVVGYLSGSQDTITGGVVDYIKENFPGAVEAAQWLWEKIKDLGAAWLEWQQWQAGVTLDVAIDIFNKLGSIISDTSDKVKEWFATFDERFPGLSKVLDKLGNLFSKIAKSIKTAIEDNIKAPFEFILVIIQDVIDLIGALVDKTMGFFEGISEPLSDMVDSMSDWWEKKFGEGGAWHTEGEDSKNMLQKSADALMMMPPGVIPTVAPTPAPVLIPTQNSTDNSRKEQTNNIYITTPTPEATAAAVEQVVDNPNITRTGVAPGVVTPTVR